MVGDDTWYSISGPENFYQYNGKEMNADFGLDWLDYGARWYDASLARWSAIDPLAEKFPAWSDYNYVLGNPVMLVDPDGRSASSPIYDENGNFLGTDSEGFKGEVIVMNRNAFNTISHVFQKQGHEKIPHNELMKLAKEKPYAQTIDNAQLPSNVWSKIFTHISQNLKTTLDEYGESYRNSDIPDMSKLLNGELSVKTITKSKKYNMVHYNHPAVGLREPNTVIRDNDIVITFNIEYNQLYTKELNTVENIQSTFTVHEYSGHGVKRFGSKTGNHYKVYELQMRHPIYKHTTSDYKLWIEENYEDYIKYEK